MDNTTDLLDRIAYLERICFDDSTGWIKSAIFDVYGPGSWDDCRERFCAETSSIAQQLAVVAVKLGMDSEPFDRVALSQVGLGSKFTVACQAMRTRLQATHDPPAGDNVSTLAVPIVRSDAKAATVEWNGTRYPVSHSWADAFQLMIGKKGVPVGIGKPNGPLRKPSEDLAALKADFPDLANIVAKGPGNSGYRLTVFDA